MHLQVGKNSPTFNAMYYVEGTGKEVKEFYELIKTHNAGTESRAKEKFDEFIKNVDTSPEEIESDEYLARLKDMVIKKLTRKDKDFIDYEFITRIKDDDQLGVKFLVVTDFDSKNGKTFFSNDKAGLNGWRNQYREIRQDPLDLFVLQLSNNDFGWRGTWNELSRKVSSQKEKMKQILACSTRGKIQTFNLPEIMEAIKECRFDLMTGKLKPKV